MNALSQFLRITHCRDILVTYVKSIRSNQNLYYKYEIPLYDDTPRGVPIIKIEDKRMIVTFTNQDL
jgi:hypothetical protein